MVKGVELLTEDERRALRGSKFAPLPSLPPPSARDQPRLAHPGGPVTTNKAVALAKFLERKLMEPGGLDSMNPDLIEMAVKNAKETVTASETSDSGRMIRHVASFGDCQVPMDMVMRDSSPIPKPKKLNIEITQGKKKLKKRREKKKKRNKKLEIKEGA